MKRAVSIEEISDGKLYGLNDLVKAGCNDCKGCCDCCQGMGSSIVLDPLDIHRLLVHLNCAFEELLENHIELNIVEGIILPNLKMAGQSERCSFLNTEGRCSIHPFRPGICRLFPLGRYYTNQTYQYFLQIKECKKENKTKVKVRNWIDTPNIKNNEQFVIAWHYFLSDLQNLIKDAQDEEQIKAMNMYVLKKFYMSPYDLEEDFYLQFQERLSKVKEII
ncbi:MAG: YkgJ family cysteine cluster protein [Lachnospiraceae bacterium]|nr:YkgJ family cysteine cluster protein [Lachnospiraceae bacterium]